MGESGDFMTVERLIFRVHAIQRMFKRGIRKEDVRQILLTGAVIEEYADNRKAGETIVITVYEPNPKEWEPDFKRRKKT